jgi:hypothetical protein
MCEPGSVCSQLLYELDGSVSSQLLGEHDASAGQSFQIIALYP